MSDNVGKYGKAYIGDEEIVPTRQVKEQVEVVNLGQETTARYGIEVPIPELVMITGCPVIPKDERNNWADRLKKLGPPINSAEFLKQFDGLSYKVIHLEALPMPDVLVEDGIAKEPWYKKPVEIEIRPLLIISKEFYPFDKQLTLEDWRNLSEEEIKAKQAELRKWHEDKEKDNG